MIGLSRTPDAAGPPAYVTRAQPITQAKHVHRLPPPFAQLPKGCNDFFSFLSVQHNPISRAKNIIRGESLSIAKKPEEIKSIFLFPFFCK
jgi:hypothetical protein